MVQQESQKCQFESNSYPFLKICKCTCKNYFVKKKCRNTAEENVKVR